MSEAKQTGESPQHVDPYGQDRICEILPVEIDREIRNVKRMRFAKKCVQRGQNGEDDDGRNGDPPDFILARSGPVHFNKGLGDC